MSLNQRDRIFARNVLEMVAGTTGDSRAEAVRLRDALALDVDGDAIKDIQWAAEDADDELAPRLVPHTEILETIEGRERAALAPKIREAVTRAISLEIGEDGYDMAEFFTQRIADRVVEAVGQVLIDEDAGPLTDADRERLAGRIGWLEQGIRLAVSDLERLNADVEDISTPHVARITEQLRKTIEGPADGVAAGTSRELSLGPCYPGSPDDERGPQ